VRHGRRTRKANRWTNGAGGIRTPVDIGLKTPISENRQKNGAESGALQSDFDPDLRQIIDAWPDLPDDVKRNILHLVKTHGRETPGR